MFLTLLITALLYIFERFASAACNGTTTILKQDDATALASCRTFTGDVAIATGVTDQIDFGDLARINGDLNATNVTLITSLGGTSLENIDGKFILNGVQVMTELSFPNLTNVGEIRWNALPNLNQFTFTAGINLVSVVNIQNSELSSLEGLNIKVADDVYIASNRHLTDITIPFTNINSSLVIEANGPAVSVSFPSLNWARNITIRNASSIDMPSLNYVDDILGFFGCDIEKIIVNTLSVVKGALFIAGNTHLTDISMPNLLSAGSLDIRNNTLVESIDGFGQLGKVIGNVELGGNFSKVLLPDLKSAGPLSINTTNTAMDCATFDDYLNEGILQSYTCNGKVHQAVGSPSTSVSSSTSSPAQTSTTGNKGLSVGAKAGIGVGVAVAAVALLSVGGFLLFRRRRRGAQPPTVDAAIKPELDGEDHWGKTRVEESQELPTGQDAVELEAPHHVSELG